LQFSPGYFRSRRRSRPELFVLALTAIAFTILVSVAASHLHVTPDADDGCALCAAFAGKIEGPSLTVPTVAVATVIHCVRIVPASRPNPPGPAHLLPPNCGPPQV